MNVGNQMAGKTIKLYISGEDSKNLKTAELSQWTGTAYIGERKHTKLIQKIDELTLPGIYFLLSNEETSSSLKKIYIGEADEVNKRINNHYRQKEWWDSFVIFVSKDTNLTKAHVRYLEKELYSIAKDKITSFQLMNSSEPTGSKLPQSDRDDMIIFKENMIFILNHLGIINFSIKDDSEMVTNQDELFLLNLTSDRIDKSGKVLQAKLLIADSRYILKKGSFIEMNERKSFSTHSYYPLRKRIESESCLDDSDFKDISVLNKDVEFSSASAAASIVKNRSTNGKKEWKLIDGTTLDDYENNLNTN